MYRKCYGGIEKGAQISGQLSTRIEFCAFKLKSNTSSDIYIRPKLLKLPES